MILYAWAASLVTITAGRFLYSRWLRLMQRRGQGLERVLIVGTGEVGRTILQKIQYTGATGPISFDDKGDRKDAEITIFTMKSGKLEPTAVYKGGKVVPYQDFVKTAAK